MRGPTFSWGDTHSPRLGRRATVLALPGSKRLSLAVVWVAFGLLLSLGVALLAQAQGTGTLEGQVVNGTAGAAQVDAGLPVTLRVLQGDSEIDALQSVTDAGGRFRFEGLDPDPGLEYWPEVVYLDVAYSSTEPFRFEGDQTALSATINVYETTPDDSAIRLSSVHIIAESFGEVLRLSEIHIFGNMGDRTYIGSQGDTGQKTTLFLPLPGDAVGLSFGDEVSQERFIEVEGGLMDTEPVVPGNEASLVFFSYHLMAGSETIPVERRFAYPVTILNILVAQPGLTLESEQLQSMGVELFQGREYEFYATQNLGSDTSLRLDFVPVAEAVGGTTVEGMPPASGEGLVSASARGNQGLLLWLGFGLAAMAVLGAVVYPMVSRRPASYPEAAPNLTADPKAQQLVAELADLEDALEAGQIEEETYERQRGAIREELKSL